MRHRRPPFSLVDLAIILALACLAVIGYKVSPLLTQADLTSAPLPACDLNTQACAAELPGGGRVELTITPRPIPVVKPLQVSVRLSGMAADKLEIDFAGHSMNMGYNRLALVADGDGAYRGAAMLPVCISGRMVWQATLLIDSAGRKIAVPFLFEAPEN
ncbi:MAG: hypothetical protein H6R17_3292 [Proteobacteria bacterium]|nr:hypothetical protein [Pseudomonadota bacterium]